MIDVEIRQANINDSNSIFQLNCDGMGYYYGSVKTENRLQLIINNPEHKIYVAIVDLSIVRYIHANNYDLIYCDPLKKIIEIAVVKEYKHKDLGKKLLN